MSTNNSVEPNNQSNAVSPKKSIKKKYIILGIVGLFLIILVASVWYKKQYILLYYGNAKYNDFKIGNKLYAKNSLINETSKYGSYNLYLYRKIRPLNDDDVDKMNISLSEKALIKNTLNNSDKPGMMESSFYISSDSLCKYKTACIGNYTGAEILDIKFEHQYFPMVFFSLTTNKKALVKDETDFHKLPSGYVYDDGPFYVRLFDVTHQELYQFRKPLK